jgi:phosphotransferase system enzyme I (PtsI)
VEVQPTDEQVERARLSQRAAVAVIRERVRTTDGAEIEVAANAGSVADVEAGMAAGADGVGLFRTEFLYLGRSDMPGEDEQYAIYQRAADVLAGRPFVIRTLDAGGDKALPSLPPSPEPNPFLGLRGLRLCLKQPALLVPQLRAALRLGAVADVRLMFPMVSFVEEVRQAKALVAVCAADLSARGVAVGRIQVGIMVETPGAALLAERFAPEVDFFSLGTNDLTQYTLAVDRTNERVAHLYQPLHPAVLSLVGQVAEAAHRHGRWVGVCGEMAASPEAIPLLVGLGVDELSVAPPAVAHTKAAVQRLARAEAQRLAHDALRCATPAEVEALVGASRTRSPVVLLSERPAA